MLGKIKVLYVLHDTSINSGASRSFISCLKELLKLGIEPVVIVPNELGIVEELKELKVDYFSSPFRNAVFPPINNFKNLLRFIPKLLHTLLLNIYSSFAVYWFAQKQNVDIVHTNVSPVCVGYRVSKMLRKRHVWHIREYQDLYYGWTPLFSMASYRRKLRDETNYTITVTEKLKSHYAISRQQKVIPDGVQYHDKLLSISAKKPRFLFVGRVERGKGIAEVILSFIEFNKKQKGYELLIAGNINDSKFHNELMLHVIAHELSKQVVFLGPRTDVFDLMRNSTAIVVASKHEGFGMITAEAMFNGCLVIGHNSGGTSEILRDGKYGLLYDTEDELCQKMLEVSTNGSAYYTNMITDAQSFANENYSIEACSVSIFNFYKEILK